MTVRIRARVAAVLLASAAVAVVPAVAGRSAHASSAPAMTDVHYAGGPLETFDVYPGRTANRGPHPWVFMVHGGSWAWGDKRDPSVLAARDAFVSQGLTVVSVNYRLAGPDTTTTYADEQDDVTAAYDYLRAHAHTYHLDPDRAIVYGFSAGGHLAAILGLSGGGRGIRGIVTSSGVLAPQATLRAGVRATWQEADLYAHEVRLAGGPVSTGWGTFLPQNHLSAGDPPILAFHGADDRTVPSTEPLLLRDYARAHHVPMTVVIAAGWGHTYALLWAVPANRDRALAFARARLDCPATGC